MHAPATALIFSVMKRYSAFDPPEYLAWEPDPELDRAYIARIKDDPDRFGIVSDLSKETFVALYRDLLVTRLFDVGLKRWVRTGVISKAWLGTGEEAVTVGAVAPLQPGLDVVSPMIRNAGALHMMGMSLDRMFKGYLATADAPNGGRDLHVGDLDLGIVQPISGMGVNVPVVTGMAMALARRGEGGVAMTWVGDGATRCAATHEGANFAAVQNAPVVFIVQNNQVALGTRIDQHGAGNIEAWPALYGIPSTVVDGNHVLDVYAATLTAVELCRSGRGPVAVVANTFRMGGHATHDEREARDTFDAELFRQWGARDPIALYERFLLKRGLTQDELDTVEAEAIDRVERAAALALESRDLHPEAENAIYDGFSEGGVLHGLATRRSDHDP